MVWLIIILSVLLVNLFFICLMVLFERKKPEFILFWLFVLIFLPILGFFIYLVLGTTLRRKIRKQIENKQISDQKFFVYQNKHLDKKISDDIYEFVKFLNHYGAGNCADNSQLSFYSTSYSKIKQLKEDIKNAKKTINIEYYIFKKDKIGREILALLCKKATEGVKVKLIYDAVGSISTPNSFFKKLSRAGGSVVAYFPSAIGIKFLNTRFNYRNHRKIVVIDGKIAYSGGMNICLDEVKNKQIRPWRDLHIRVEGNSASLYQNIFLSDYRYCVNDKSLPTNYLYDEDYYPVLNETNVNLVSVVSSGPDKKLQSIKEIMIKMIYLAKKSILIQTPYFVPDDTFLTALRQASFNGVKVVIMLPLKPDRKMMQQMAFSYANELIDFKIDFYLYNGFMHSKLIIIDDKLAMMGSCNMDNRSFSLNFEINTIFYDANNLSSLKTIFNEDMKHSIKAHKSYLRHHMPKSKVGRAFLRLISPLL